MKLHEYKSSSTSDSVQALYSHVFDHISKRCTAMVTGHDTSVILFSDIKLAIALLKKYGPKAGANLTQTLSEDSQSNNKLSLLHGCLAK